MVRIGDNDLDDAGRQQADRRPRQAYPEAEQLAGSVLRLQAGDGEWIAALPGVYVDVGEMQ